MLTFGAMLERLGFLPGDLVQLCSLGPSGFRFEQSTTVTEAASLEPTDDRDWFYGIAPVRPEWRPPGSP